MTDRHPQPPISTRIRDRAQGRHNMPTLAVLSGMTPSTLYRRLQTGEFTLPEIQRIARTLGCAPADLIN